ncbi:MAG: chromate efflux transporter [Gammaproteobacteria bacterium]
MSSETDSTVDTSGRLPFATVFLAFLRLGLTSFGGPVAHLGYFREAFVVKRRWLNENTYADLVAMSQFLPGPASSQVGIGIGLAKAGIPGAIAAWLAFTLPSTLAMIAFGYGIVAHAEHIPLSLLHGLKVVAVAVVAQAVWGMARVLCPDPPRITVAVVAAVGVLTVPSAWGQVAMIASGAVVGYLWLSPPGDTVADALDIAVAKGLAVSALATFLILLLALPLAATLWPAQSLFLIDSFYRSGALVFGGGHVVLPLLQAEVVNPGWVTQDAFLAGYGAAQAVPGPLFTFAAYLGTVSGPEPNGWFGAILCLVAVFTPSFLLVIGVMPFWNHLRRLWPIRKALIGINAAVVGLLLAALYDPVWTSGIRSVVDFMLALVAFTLLVFWRAPPWLIVVLTALASWGLEHAQLP